MPLFGKNDSKQRSAITFILRDDFVEVPELSFFGRFSRSSSGDYLLAWADWDPVRSTGGWRKTGLGRYLLVLKETLLLDGKMERPNDGHVANNGTFIFNDWMFGDGLKGTFYAFDSVGTILVKREFDANLFNNGISDDGRWSVCQTCNSDNDDGNRLILFDLESGGMLWSVQPETGWGRNYKFDSRAEVLLLEADKFGWLRFNLHTGEFLDTALLIEKKLAIGNGFDLHQIAADRIAQLSDTGLLDESDEIVRILTLALERDLEDYPNERAAILRTLGETHERIGDFGSAIDCYKRALALNPRVGIKRRLSQLETERR